MTNTPIRNPLAKQSFVKILIHFNANSEKRKKFLKGTACFAVPSVISISVSAVCRAL